MPAKSAKQYSLMQAVAHGAKPYKGKGPSQKVAREFIKETSPERRSRYARQAARQRSKRR